MTIAVVAGVATVAVLAVLLWQSGACRDTSYHGSPNQTVGVSQQKNFACTDPEFTSIQRLACSLEAINSRQDSKEETQRAQSDLDAQWKMAYWARCMFWAAIAQAVIGLLGLLAIWRTLHWTREAVREAANATKAAHAAVDVTIKGTARQLRAYVHFERGNIDAIRIDHRPEAHIFVQNYGQTPASELIIWWNFVLREYPLQGDLPEPHEGTIPVLLAPHASHHSVRHFGEILTQEHLLAIERGGTAYYIYGRIEYSDGFHPNPRQTKFTYYITGNNGTLKEYGAQTAD